MAQCRNCFKESKLISSPLRLCAECILQDFPQVKSHIEAIHSQCRTAFRLPGWPPRAETGVVCAICVNECQIPEGGRGYCGIRTNIEGKISGGFPSQGLFSYYYDNLPTNCVADWVCPAGPGSGYPEHSYSEDMEVGYKNLAVFFESCTFDCLFCQNWHYRQRSTKSGHLGPEAIANNVDNKTACICYFGGDPSSQMVYALKASRLARENNPGRILRICWETNGSMNPKLLDKAAQISLESGGCIKFDLKAWHDKLHTALCGVSNRQTLSNFKRMAEYGTKRPDPPFLVASTLLVPGYIDEEEVSLIAQFIAGLNPDIPYSLLGFYPQFQMQDLPTTSREHAERCHQAAMQAGLNRVKIGNLHLLR